MTLSPQQLLVAQLRAQGISNQSVLDAVAHTPREHFISSDLAAYAYGNNALPINCQQTISQPYIVALMTQALLADHPCHRVLEIGTGSGYQAAVLSELVNEVYSVERLPKLHEQAQQVLTALSYDNVFLKLGDGSQGWAEHGPYDGIIVTAAAHELPALLVSQLAEGGHLIIPLQEHDGQKLYQFTKLGGQLQQHFLEHVVFVPLL